MATGPFHYAEAERILAVAVLEHDRLSTHVDSVEQVTALRRAVGDMIAIAQVHATLALAAATALKDPDSAGFYKVDRLEWEAAASAFRGNSEASG